MPDEAQAPEQVQETPTPEAPAQPETPEVNWEERYQNLRPEFDRKSQRLSELEALEQKLRDPETAPEVLAEFGYSFGDENEDTPEDEFADPYETRLTALEAELKAQKEREQQFAALQKENEYVNSEVERLEKSIDRELDDDEYELITSLAATMRDERGQPQVEAAYKRLYDDFGNKLKANWVDGKRSARPTSGPGAAAVPDLDNPEELESYIDNMLDS